MSHYMTNNSEFKIKNKTPKQKPDPLMGNEEKVHEERQKDLFSWTDLQWSRTYRADRRILNTWGDMKTFENFDI